MPFCMKGEERMRKIAVIFGGCSTEYEVSLQSAYAVLTHLDRKKYEIKNEKDSSYIWRMFNRV